MHILGISCSYNDSAACILKDGIIAAAAQEERFTRREHDPAFPAKAVEYCLEEAGIEADELDYVAFHEKPLRAFKRVLRAYLDTAPKGLRSWLRTMPYWLGRKLSISKAVRREIGFKGRILFSGHQESHAASAFYPSPFDEAAVLVVDGAGEWATSSYGEGVGNKIFLRNELRFPDSLGLLYSAFTRFTGFAVNSGELELMALAPFGRPVYRDLIMEELIDLKEDGSVRLNPDYFDVLGVLCVTNKRFDLLFGGPPRRPRGAITRREADIAASIQSVTEEAVLRMSRHVRRETGLRYLCLAGDLASNSSVNGRLLREGSFEGVWVQPAAGDAGGALGAAFWVWYGFLGNPRVAETESDSMKGSYLGPSFSADKVLDFLDVKRCPCIRLEGPEKSRIVAEQIAAGKIVGYMAGRMEFGPNALGARSILGDPRKAETRSGINVNVKSREPFRPLGLTVLEERAADYFELETPSPYMLFSAAFKGERSLSPGENRAEGMKGGLDAGGSGFPAVACPDCSAVIQSVSRRMNPGYYDVIKAFEQITGCPLVVNAGFNMRGEPIVCTPDDAYRCFMRTGMDVLVMEDCILFKEEQPRRR